MLYRKEAEHDKEKQYGLLASTRNLWHQLIFWMVFTWGSTDKSDAVPSTGEYDDSEKAQGVGASAWPPGSLTEALLSPVKQHGFLSLMKRANNFLARIADLRLKKILFIVSFQSSFQVPEYQ